jgi:hypothetical protein
MEQPFWLLSKMNVDSFYFNSLLNSIPLNPPFPRGRGFWLFYFFEIDIGYFLVVAFIVSRRFLLMASCVTLTLGF